MQCTFCDNACAAGSGRAQLCLQCLAALAPSTLPAEVCAIPTGPGLLRFFPGGLCNCFKVFTPGKSSVTAVVTSALTGALAGHTRVFEQADGSAVEYAVTSPHVHRIVIYVHVDGSPAGQFSVSDAVHFSGKLVLTRAMTPAAAPSLLAVSPDGQAGVIVPAAGPWLLFNPQTDEPPLPLAHMPSAAHVCWSAYRTLLAVGAGSTTIMEVGLLGTDMRIIDFGAPLDALAASAVLLAAACDSSDERDKRIWFAEYCSGEMSHAWGTFGCGAHLGQLDRVTGMRFAREGTVLGIVGSHAGVFLFAVADGMFLRALGTTVPPCSDLEFIDGGRSVLVCYDNVIATLTLSTGEMRDEVTCPGQVDQLGLSLHRVLAFCEGTLSLFAP